MSNDNIHNCVANQNDNIFLSIKIMFHSCGSKDRINALRTEFELIV